MEKRPCCTTTVAPIRSTFGRVLAVISTRCKLHEVHLHRCHLNSPSSIQSERELWHHWCAVIGTLTLSLPSFTRLRISALSMSVISKGVRLFDHLLLIVCCREIDGHASAGILCYTAVKTAEQLGSPQRLTVASTLSRTSHTP